MPPTIHFVRHGQGVHNTGSGNYSIQDPKLTPVGIDQCLNLRRTFPLSDKVGLVVASPLTRTIETALQAFEPIITRTGTSIIALPELQETGDIPCDTGSPLKVLERNYAGKPVDLGLLDGEWHVKRGKYAQTDPKITARARAARRWLKDRAESDIVVVTHGGYLHYITEDWSDAGKYCGTFKFLSIVPP